MRRADVSWTGPAGGIVSTPRDLTRWVRGLFGSHVVPPAQLAQMKELISVKTSKPIARTKADDPQDLAWVLGNSTNEASGRSGSTKE